MSFLSLKSGATAREVSIGICHDYSRLASSDYCVKVVKSNYESAPKPSGVRFGGTVKVRKLTECTYTSAVWTNISLLLLIAALFVYIPTFG